MNKICQKEHSSPTTEKRKKNTALWKEWPLKTAKTCLKEEKKRAEKPSVNKKNKC